jgi:hypothetical protein
MRARGDERTVLVGLFRRKKIVELKDLFTTLKTSSRMTVFRRLSILGYLVSCSHTGRFYTLKTIPQYDANGLWRYADVLFSRDGTLKEAVRRLVEESDNGRFHRELEGRLQLRVHNTLADLIDRRLLGRELLGGDYLYVSADERRAKLQIGERGRHVDDERKSKIYPPTIVIEVLLEVIHSAKAYAGVDIVAERLEARGVAVQDVDEILLQHGVVKKTARSRSTRSRS